MNKITTTGLIAFRWILDAWLVLLLLSGVNILMLESPLVGTEEIAVVQTYAMLIWPAIIARLIVGARIDWRRARQSK